MANEEIIQIFNSFSTSYLENSNVPPTNVGIFSHQLNIFWILTNDTDQYYGSVPSDVKSAVRANFNVGIDEEILMVRDTSFWNSRDQGLVITDCGIHCIPDNDNSQSAFAFSWQCINRVMFKDEVYYFYDDISEPWWIHQSLFFKSSDDAALYGQTLGWVMDRMAKAQEQVDTLSLLEEFNELVFNEDVTASEVQNRGLELKDTEAFNDYGVCLILTRIARKWLNEALCKRTQDLPYEQWSSRKNECIDSALDWLKAAETWINDEIRGGMIGEMEWIRSWIMRFGGEYVESMRNAIKALGESTDESDQGLLRDFINCKSEGPIKLAFERGYGILGESIEEFRVLHEADYQNDLKEADKVGDEELRQLAELEHQDWLEQMESGDRFFSHRPYQERQFIFIVRDIEHIGGCYDPSDNIKYVFPIDQMPGDVGFPLGHPQPNTLYYAHPLRPYYLPAETANKELFFEKIQEYSRLLQCLGATRITLRCIKGRSVNEGVSSLANIDGSIETWVADVKASANSGSSVQSERKSHDELTETKYYIPTRKPYCPADLIWAAMDPEMNSLAKQRLEGGLTHVSRKVSSKETMSVSSSRFNEVHATFDHFMATVSANYNAKTDTTFLETNETIWEIEADFKPLSEYTSGASEGISSLPIPKQLTKAETEYLDEYKFILEDGEITERERRSLERLRLKLGLSPQCVNMLEASVSAINLSDDEREYLEEYRNVLADGEITARERRSLERLSSKLGLSAQQVATIEKLA